MLFPEKRVGPEDQLWTRPRGHPLLLRQDRRGSSHTKLVTVPSGMRLERATVTSTLSLHPPYVHEARRLRITAPMSPKTTHGVVSETEQKLPWLLAMLKPTEALALRSFTKLSLATPRRQ